MFIGTHTFAPLLAASVIDALRLRNGANRLFSKSRLIALGLAGALPDLLSPHLALRARYSSWTHTLWFVLGIFPVLGIICRSWYRQRWVLLAHCLWLASVAHIATDAISGGIRPWYPYGPIIRYRLISHSLWVPSDIVVTLLTALLVIWVTRRERRLVGPSGLDKTFR